MAIFKLAKTMLTPSGMFRFLPYLLIVPIIVFETLSLTGCVSTSPAIPNIYIVSLRPNNNATGTATPQVRVGYFGICGISESGTRCQSASGQSVDTLVTNLFLNGTSPSNTTTTTTTTTRDTTTPDTTEITDLVSTALDLQSRIFISVLAGAAVLFVLGLAALFFLRRDVRSTAASWEGQPLHPRRSAAIRRATYGLLCGSAALAFAAGLATTQAAGALEYATAGMSHATVLIHAGRTVQVLQWIAFGFEVLFVAAVPFLVRERAVAAVGEFKGEA
ncbi:2c93d951-955f-4189-a3d4-5a905f984bd7 [Thermothielavioides terrestris]|uniref:2c93d951-955f-4189-a3d4-5a905f984bd7 n=1 Tax=Thermothielavioides terrestris TaxID=2587410 RepID=A0A3S5CWN7_9PEZI|nr:2c93d951-955f-4189-a3d4-5a905f984bd7 [Thermothielavioides terrestris]